jgi:hypothetical protein
MNDNYISYNLTFKHYSTLSLMVNGLLEDNILNTIERARQRIPDFIETYLNLNDLKFKNALLKQLQLC